MITTVDPKNKIFPSALNVGAIVDLGEGTKGQYSVHSSMRGAIDLERDKDRQRFHMVIDEGGDRSIRVSGMVASMQVTGKLMVPLVIFISLHISVASSSLYAESEDNGGLIGDD
ncbi:hypothetical protein L2E82_47024 [Cichorium intybus]|uniref:Uncharacterized protein n=1 Tax=Cichorium intybus TaxID=13427 RepID=A0ACB8YUE3_CICIN|nr:hypothetical protein L2E82_47024 [Cichorium intybus]